MYGWAIKSNRIFSSKSGFSIIFLLCYVSVINTAAQLNLPNESAKTTILVLGLHPNQFYSNVYYLDELGKLNDTSRASAIDLYNRTLVSALAAYPSDKYHFVRPDSAEAARIHAKSMYVDWQNEYKEPYIALDADSVQDLAMKNLMRKYGASYLLSLNYYLIYRNSPPAYYSPVIRTRHQIHYELFTTDMGIASAGQIVLVSENSRADFMRQRYSEFAEVLLDRLQIVEGNYTTEQARKRYLLLKERLIKNKWATGFSIGWGMPYGWFGTELVRNLGSRWDVNAGIGMGPSGFKAGTGTRYYLLAYGTRFKPFFSAHYAWGSGMTIRMGGEKDESGNLINEESTTQFRIPSNQAVHLKTGFRWLRLNKALMLSGGYAIPFKPARAEMIWNGKDVPANVFNRRRKWADMFTIGGLDIGFTYIIYFL
jgi:hypothetical protein